MKPLKEDPQASLQGSWDNTQVDIVCDAPPRPHTIASKGGLPHDVQSGEVECKKRLLIMQMCICTLDGGDKESGQKG